MPKNVYPEVRCVGQPQDTGVHQLGNKPVEWAKRLEKFDQIGFGYDSSPASLRFFRAKRIAFQLGN